jgi:hypothetical protein
MPIEDNLPWQKRCERARRILAEGVLHSKPPWPDAKKRRDFIQKCLGYSGLTVQVMRNLSMCLRNAFSKAKRNFQAGGCREVNRSLRRGERPGRDSASAYANHYVHGQAEE